MAYGWRGGIISANQSTLWSLIQFHGGCSSVKPHSFRVIKSFTPSTHGPDRISPFMHRVVAGRGCVTLQADHLASTSRHHTSMKRHNRAASPAFATDAAAERRASRPLLLLDIMDTVVVDPFFKHMPSFFGMTFHELLEAKHPTTWVEFERGEITDEELCSRFFKDGRRVDGAALIAFMLDAYCFVQGMDDLLERLAARYEVHAVSNYPVWHELIEEKLRLSRYLNWTFISCQGPMQGLRKPSAESFEAVIRHLSLPPQDMIFVDDRAVNVQAAQRAGMRAVVFESAGQLEKELKNMGLEF